jgi:hypothetical protein
MGRNNADFQTSALYHGTSHVFSPGDIILPISKLEQVDYADDINLANAWATADLSSARDYAQESGYRHDKPPRVYHVSPVNAKDVQQDDVFPEVHYSPSGFKVIKEVSSRKK